MYILKISISIFIALFLAFNFTSCCCCMGGGGNSTPVAINTATPVTGTPSDEKTSQPDISEGSSKIDALYYVGTKPPSGGTSEVTIKIQPNKEGELRVGFFEEEVGGTGNMWKSSGWMAVVLSSMLLGKNATDYEFSFSVGGRIDGPSAGCLMTVGVLAALRGKNIKEDATMTGTINPDGTVGPVGGIPQKLEGAAKKGKKLVLIPVGLRYCNDMATGSQVDVVEKGKKLGIEVKEVSNIYDAYELLTGDEIPLLSSSVKKPELPSKAFDRIKGKAKEWYSRYQKARGEFKTFPQKYQEYFAGQVDVVDAMAAKSDQALGQGMVSVAYNRAVQSASSMEALVLSMSMIQHYNSNGINDVVDYLESKQSVKTDLSAMLDILKAEEPETASDYISLFNSYSNVGMAQGFILLGNDKVNEIAQNAKKYTEDELLDQLWMATLYYTSASTVIEQARDALDVAKGIGKGGIVKNKDEIKQLGDVISGASKANMSYFESTIVDEYASAYGKHPDAMKNLFMQIDGKYMIATASTVGANIMKDEFADKKDAAPMIIGEAASSYALSSQLIAKYYSLDAKLDKSLTQIVSIGNEKALADMLDFADKRAVELINLNGEENSVLPIFFYENARMSRQGTPQEQLEALGYYWEFTILSEIYAYMAGNIGE